MGDQRETEVCDLSEAVKIWWLPGKPCTLMRLKKPKVLRFSVAKCEVFISFRGILITADASDLDRILLLFVF